jgi:HD-like signal output (HDOD) protein
MLETRIPDVSTLKRMRALVELNDIQLLALASQLKVNTATTGELLLEQGSTEDSSLYVLGGNVELIARDGRQKQVSIGQSGELHPLGQLRPSFYDITALEPVEYLKISKRQLVNFTRVCDFDSEDISVHSLFTDTEDSSHSIVYHIYQGIMERTVGVPLLEDFAQKLQETYQGEGTPVGVMANLFGEYPDIASKLIIITHQTPEKVTLTTQSLVRIIKSIGVTNIYFIVMTIAVNRLLLGQPSAIQKRLQNLWHRNRYVAAISRALAKSTGQFNHNKAMFAGMCHNVGSLLVVDYLVNKNDFNLDTTEADYAIFKLAPEFSCLMLGKWGFDEDVIKVSQESYDWFRNPSENIELCDLVMIANYHSLVRFDETSDLPNIKSIPAMKKIDMSPDKSLKLLKETRLEIQKIQTILH